MCECIQTIGKPVRHSPGCPKGFPNKPHKHAALIKAWADGAQIQYKDTDGKWWDTHSPYWEGSVEYRIKPEPKPDIVRYGCLYTNAHLNHQGIYRGESGCASEGLLSVRKEVTDNIKVIFDGETGKLKAVEIIK